MKFHESSEFIKNLDSYLFNPNALASSYLKTNKNRIPLVFRSCNKTLYRGMFLSDEDRKLLDNGKFRFDRVTSWTKESSIAEAFLKDVKFKIQNKKSTPVVLKKNFQVNDIIIDIDAYVQFYGEKKLLEMGFDDLNIDSAMKEKEVLIMPIVIKRAEYQTKGLTS